MTSVLAGLIAAGTSGGPGGFLTLGRKREHRFSASAPGSRVLATSARSYGCDYAVPNARNLSQAAGMVLGKSVVLTGSQMINEYNIIVEKALQQELKGDDADPVDWDKFQEKYLEMFYKVLAKTAATDTIKKVFEGVLQQVVSPKIFDRLTKLPLKSAHRKLAKYKRCATAAYKMLYTSLWSSALTFSSVITLDIAMAIYEHCSECSRKRKRLIQSNGLEEMGGALVWVGKRVAYYSIIVVGSVSGFSIGFYLSPNYGGHIGPLLGEGIANALATELLGQVS